MGKAKSDSPEVAGAITPERSRDLLRQQLDCAPWGGTFVRTLWCTKYILTAAPGTFLAKKVPNKGRIHQFTHITLNHSFTTTRTKHYCTTSRHFKNTSGDGSIPQGSSSKGCCSLFSYTHYWYLVSICDTESIGVYDVCMYVCMYVCRYLLNCT